METRPPGRLDRVLAIAIPPHSPTGDELRMSRHAERIGQTALARQMGVSRQYVDEIERKPAPTPAAIARYQAALVAAIAARRARREPDR